jgi:hypothetical protein
MACEIPRTNGYFSMETQSQYRYNEWKSKIGLSPMPQEPGRPVRRNDHFTMPIL